MWKNGVFGSNPLVVALPQNKISISIYNPLKNRLLAVPNEPILRVTAAHAAQEASCLPSCTSSGNLLLWVAAQVAWEALASWAAWAAENISAWPSVTKSVITSSRNIGIAIRKVRRKLDFRGFQSIGGRTHNSIGAERYGPRNIEVLHWPKIIFSLFLPICSFSPSFDSFSSKMRFNTTRMEWTYTCSTNTLNNLIYSRTKHK